MADWCVVPLSSGLTGDTLRALVLTQPLECGMAHQAIAAPTAELNLADELRLDEAHALASIRASLRANGLLGFRIGSRRRWISEASLSLKPVPTRPAWISLPFW
jgi:hypothetical protein